PSFVRRTARGKAKVQEIMPIQSLFVKSRDPSFVRTTARGKAKMKEIMPIQTYYLFYLFKTRCGLMK
ncbi:MAG: hypothetical protein KUL85_11125, partial [Sphingobacterium mizutaii]|nr:hypothetical protein [Sphingobacterium mizutaii]